jgi:predicted methyltransferase
VYFARPKPGGCLRGIVAFRAGVTGDEQIHSILPLGSLPAGYQDWPTIAMPKIVCLALVTMMSTACAERAAHPVNPPPLASPQPSNGSPPVSAKPKLAQVVAGAQRTDDERKRDTYRHPLETLDFFGIAENMHVVELNAGQGWYTAILGPFLNPSGALTVTSADQNGPPDSEGTKNAKALAARLGTDPASYSKVTMVVADWKNPGVSLGPDASADMVVTFRNLHGWIHDGILDNVLSASFRVLKHGGILGVEQHRGKPDGPTDPKSIGDSGYVPEGYVVLRVESAGFKLSGKSELNANPKDTKDYPKGVWTLPPTFRLGDVDREKYAAIGESDRMTLKFVKP